MFEDRTKKIEQILSVGTIMPIFNFTNWGLTRIQALNALVELRDLSIPVLGGDVLKLENGEWVHSYDNWYCNRLPPESDEEFVIRSSNAASAYIRNYKTSDKSENLFIS